MYIAAERWNSVIPKSHKYAMSESQEKFKDTNRVIGQTIQMPKDKGQITQWPKDKGQITQWPKDKGQITQ